MEYQNTWCVFIYVSGSIYIGYISGKIVYVIEVYILCCLGIFFGNGNLEDLLSVIKYSKFIFYFIEWGGWLQSLEKSLCSCVRRDICVFFKRVYYFFLGIGW